MPFDGTDNIRITRLQQFTPFEADCGCIWAVFINGKLVGARNSELMLGPQSPAFFRRCRDQIGVDLRTTTASAWVDLVCAALRTAKPCPLWVLLYIGAESDEDFEIIEEMLENDKKVK